MGTEPTTLPRLVFAPESRFEKDFAEDVTRLVEACRVAGFAVSRTDVTNAYATFSEEHYCASWLVLGPDERLFECVREYLKPAADD